MGRRWQMTRVAAGDYLLPSNDAKSLWRIHSYLEDGSAEYSDGRKLVGTFWAASKYRRPMPDGAIPEDFLDWDNWEPWAHCFRTRRDAIEVAL